MPAKIRINQNRIKLESKMMRALTMRCLDGFTYEEIGRRLGISEPGAYYRVQRAINIILEARENELRLCKG